MGGERPCLTVPDKLVPGDRVAVVSPSFAAPGQFPAVHDLAMRRLRDDIGLQPVEYPTTRQLGASPEVRAADLMVAFADPDIKAVLATIGGEDQLTVLPFLDAEVAAANPKAFVGYSDNTNLLSWLWNLGVACYHGGSTMVHLGRAGALHPVSAKSPRAALLDGGDLALHGVERFSEDEVAWANLASLLTEAPPRPSPGWTWHQSGLPPHRPGVATWRSSTGSSPPTGGYARWRTTPVASSCLRPPRKCPPPSRCSGCSATWESGACSPSSPPSWPAPRRLPASASRRTPESGCATGKTSRPRCCGPSTPTTPTP